MTLEWDLSQTPLAQSTGASKAPTEGELLALMVGLLMLEDTSYEALTRCEIVLHEDNLRHLVEIFEYRLPELAREFGDSERLRERLAELTGVRVTRPGEWSPCERGCHDNGRWSPDEDDT